jgi:hypothetical protein
MKLAIESTNVNAVGLLLDSGASPDMGDDDQMWVKRLELQFLLG